MVTAPAEGSLYSQRKDSVAPIRIYSDRWVEDDIFASMGGSKKRERLSKNEYRKIRHAAKRNDGGRV